MAYPSESTGKPMYQQLEARVAKLQARVEELERQLAESESEREEQARLLGMSGSREAKLQAQLAEARELLAEIAAPSYGLDLTDDVEYRARYWANQTLRLQQIAREALAGQGDDG